MGRTSPITTATKKVKPFDSPRRSGPAGLEAQAGGSGFGAARFFGAGGGFQGSEPSAVIPSTKAHHVTPEQAGEVFARTKPRLAVYSHIVQPIASEQDLVPPTRKTYGGPVEVGEDLMVIEVGEKIKIRRPK